MAIIFSLFDQEKSSQPTLSVPRYTVQSSCHRWNSFHLGSALIQVQTVSAFQQSQPQVQCSHLKNTCIYMFIQDQPLHGYKLGQLSRSHGYRGSVHIWNIRHRYKLGQLSSSLGHRRSVHIWKMTQVQTCIYMFIQDQPWHRYKLGQLSSCNCYRRSVHI